MYVGMVFWGHGGKSNRNHYQMGNVNVMPGYVFIVKSETILGESSTNGVVHGKAFQHIVGSDTLAAEKLRGLNSAGFYYLPCLGTEEGFAWASGALDSTPTNAGTIPLNQQNAIRKAIQQFWDSNGRTQNLMLDRNCVHN